MAAGGYGAPVQALFAAPEYVGSFDPRDSRVGTALVGTIATGALLKLQIRVRGGQIASACFRAFGCGATIAAGSWTARWLHDRSLAQAQTLGSAEIVAALELPPVKMHCALLAEDAVKAAVADYNRKHTS